MPAATCARPVPPAVAAPPARSTPVGAVVCRRTPAHRWSPARSDSRWSSRPPPDRQRLHRDRHKQSNRLRSLEFHSRSSAPPASRAEDSGPDPRARASCVGTETGPMGQAQKCRVRAPPHPLYGSRAGTPRTCRAQPEQIYRDRNSSPAEPAGYSLPGNGPFLLERSPSGPVSSSARPTA